MKNATRRIVEGTREVRLAYIRHANVSRRVLATATARARLTPTQVVVSGDSVRIVRSRHPVAHTRAIVRYDRPRKSGRPIGHFSPFSFGGWILVRIEPEAA